MKVLLVNGSPHEKGCTYTALSEIAVTLEKEGIEAEIFWVGNQAVHGCIACKTCKEKGQCVFDDRVNEFTKKAVEADGFVFGSPVYYASANGTLMSFMDRAFYSAKPGTFYLKPGAAVTSARRAGTTATLDEINKYFQITQMPIISSSYWNMVHGGCAEDVQKDEEGLHTMRTLAKNMAWFLKIKKAGMEAGIPLPGNRGQNFYKLYSIKSMRAGNPAAKDTGGNMVLDDILKLIQQLLSMYKGSGDKERIEAILENTYALIMESEDSDDAVIDFMDAVMFDVDYLIEHRGEIVAQSDNEKENRKRRRKMLDMFREDY